MSKKHKKHEEHVDESWLVPYSDMLTLLMALFMVLFAMSSIDSAKFKQLAVSLNSELTGGTGQEEFLSAIKAEEEKELAEKKALEELKKEEQMKQSEMSNLEELQKKIDKYIEENDMKLSLKTSLTEQGLIITILDDALFESGDAVVKASSKQLAMEISKLLVTNPARRIMVEGHTDNQPINNAQYRSNWDLSVGRAVNFMQLLLKNNNLKPDMFSAVGHGEYKPLESNKTGEGRAKNRRVEVLILPNQPTKTDTTKENKKEAEPKESEHKETKEKGH